MYNFDKNILAKKKIIYTIKGKQFTVTTESSKRSWYLDC